MVIRHEAVDCYNRLPLTKRRWSQNVSDSDQSVCWQWQFGGRQGNHGLYRVFSSGFSILFLPWQCFTSTLTPVMRTITLERFPSAVRSQGFIWLAELLLGWPSAMLNGAEHIARWFCRLFHHELLSPISAWAGEVWIDGFPQWRVRWCIFWMAGVSHTCWVITRAEITGRRVNLSLAWLLQALL